MTTYMAKKESITRKWSLIDAEGKKLGRVATVIAARLRGKHRAEFTPHADTGDFVIVINVDKIQVTGKKETDKLYHHYTGYPSGMKTESWGKLKTRAPTQALELAVKGMLPKGPLAHQMRTKLKLYAGAQHPHEAQKPEKIDV